MAKRMSKPAEREVSWSDVVSGMAAKAQLRDDEELRLLTAATDALDVTDWEDGKLLDVFAQTSARSPLDHRAATQYQRAAAKMRDELLARLGPDDGSDRMGELARFRDSCCAAAEKLLRDGRLCSDAYFTVVCADSATAETVVEALGGASYALNVRLQLLRRDCRPFVGLRGMTRCGVALVGVKRADLPAGTLTALERSLQAVAALTGLEPGVAVVSEF